MKRELRRGEGRHAIGHGFLIDRVAVSNPNLYD